MTVLVSKVDHSRIDSNNHQIQIIAKMEILQFIYFNLFILGGIQTKLPFKNIRNMLNEIILGFLLSKFHENYEKVCLFHGSQVQFAFLHRETLLKFAIN